MKPKEQRIAIAEACGFINVRMWSESCIASMGVSDEGKYWGSLVVPDYLKDRNSMHEALLTLSDNDDFTAHLDQVIYEDNRRLVSKMDGVRATTKQLAKAYLVTIGKWEGRSDE